MLQENPRIMTDVPLSSLLEEFLKKNHKQAAFNEQTAVARFPELLPENVRSHIQKVRVANGVLFVSCDNAALRFELTNRRSELLAQLNEGFVEAVISDIVVR